MMAGYTVHIVMAGYAVHTVMAGYAVHMKESYENLKILLTYLQHNKSFC